MSHKPMSTARAVYNRAFRLERLDRRNFRAAGKGVKLLARDGVYRGQKRTDTTTQAAYNAWMCVIDSTFDDPYTNDTARERIVHARYIRRLRPWNKALARPVIQPMPGRFS